MEGTSIMGLSPLKDKPLQQRYDLDTDFSSKPLYNRRLNNLRRFEAEELGKKRFYLESQNGVVLDSDSLYDDREEDR